MWVRAPSGTWRASLQRLPPAGIAVIGLQQTVERGGAPHRVRKVWSVWAVCRLPAGSGPRSQATVLRNETVAQGRVGATYMPSSPDLCDVGSNTGRFL